MKIFGIFRNVLLLTWDRVRFYSSFLFPRWLRGRGSFTLIVHEPLGGKPTVKTMPADGRSLYEILGSRWKNINQARLRSPKSLGLPHWEMYQPRSGDALELFPGSGMKSFTSAFIARLNAETEAGVWVQALIITKHTSPPVTAYFVDHPQSVTFDGNAYTPVPMRWGDHELSETMTLPQMTVTVPNLGGDLVKDFFNVETLQADVVLQMLNLDLLGDPAHKDELMLQVQGIDADMLVAVYDLGLNLGLSDILPRKVVTKKEFPGVTQTVRRLAA